MILGLLAFGGSVRAARPTPLSSPPVNGFGEASPEPSRRGAEGPEVGDRAPDFELKDSKGKSYRLSEFEGKNVVVKFIRSGSW